ncbi:MAG TPA: hypothetical protein VJ608_15470 [Albitalea sp.]|nr:hypothetical protein [Albitalea sp.]
MLEESFPHRSDAAVREDFGEGGYLRSLAVTLVAQQLRCTTAYARRVVDRWVAERSAS